MYRSKGIKAFGEISNPNYMANLDREMHNEIENKSKKFILETNEEDYIAKLVDRFTLIPLKIDLDSEDIKSLGVSKEPVKDPFGRTFTRDVHTLKVNYSFTGTPELFNVTPPTFGIRTAYIEVNKNEKKVGFILKSNGDPNAFKEEKNAYYNNAFSNLEHMNNFVTRVNQTIASSITSIFNNTKLKHQRDDDFLKNIGAK